MPDDPQLIAHRARLLLLRLAAAKRDGTANPRVWERECVALMPEVMRVLAEACGIDVKE